jgi:hypothetical protein
MPDIEIKPHHSRAACEVDMGGWRYRHFVTLGEALRQCSDRIEAKHYVGIDINPGKSARSLVAHVQGIGFTWNLRFDHSNLVSKPSS